MTMRNNYPNDAMFRPIPALDSRLVEALNERFPERCPDPEMSDREIWIEAGKRSVVRFLIDQLENQKNNLLEN
tara:strand:- start:2712 stop:2930 length:219 start_codon:yes stop_codon:yes gene_type:complete